MPKYDIENLLSDLKNIVVNKLNTKLTSINSEKNDSITLMPLDTTQIYFQQLNRANAAASQLFLFYGVDDPLVDGIGPNSLQKLEMFFILCFANTGEDATYMTRLLRYMRAMQEIFQENYSTIPQVGRLMISSLSPVPLNEAGLGGFAAVGVKIKANLT